MNIPYKPQTIRQTKELILADEKHWQIPLMDFVDDFRRAKDVALVAEPFAIGHERWDALLASTVQQLCLELKLEPPVWVHDIPACRDPWFVSGIDSLRAITLVESPVAFRLRKIFVLGNFLSRA